MQDTYRQIFEMAKRDCPEQVFRFHSEEAVIYFGFRISKKDGEYRWRDARFNDYFEPVDPIITEKILELGFKECILQVIRHTDEDRVVKLNRDMKQIEAEIDYWTAQASKAHNRMKKQVSKAQKDKEKIAKIKERCEKKKKKYAKKRGVLKSEKEALQADIKFYESRIKLYQTQEKN